MEPTDLKISDLNENRCAEDVVAMRRLLDWAERELVALGTPKTHKMLQQTIKCFGEEASRQA